MFRHVSASRRSLVVLLLFAMLGSVQAQNFILNGTFDTFVPNNGTGGSWTSINVESPGWSATGGNPGARFLLNASGQAATNPTIQQTITGLTIGQSYTVMGDYVIHVPIGNPANSFAVLLDNAPLLQLGNPGITWTPFSIEFIATSSSHLIGLEAERGDSDHSYLIDNIQVVAAAVPEPATWAMISLAISGGTLAGWRLRNRRRHRRRR